jgi:hypothetical protein
MLRVTRKRKAKVILRYTILLSNRRRVIGSLK